jgi:hypothetical protein
MNNSDPLSAFDDIEAPDLSDEIHRRGPRAPIDEVARRPQRFVTVAVASAATVLAMLLVIRAFGPAAQPRDAGNGRLTTLVQGVEVSWPEPWTLIQLAGRPRSDDWPILQLTNYQVAPMDRLCPNDMSLPADGVLLYVQRDFGHAGTALPEWPVDPPDIGAAEHGPCGDGVARVAWRSGTAAYEATLAVGSAATSADRATLLEAFRGLRFVYPDSAKGWRRWRIRVAHDPANTADLMFGSKYVVWSAGNRTLLIPMAGPPRVGAAEFGPDVDVFGAERVAFQGDKHYDFASYNHRSGGVDAFGFVSPATEKLVLQTSDGRAVNATIGPSLERFGINARPTHLRFTPSRPGWFVAYDASGNELGRQRDVWLRHLLMFERRQTATETPPAETPEPPTVASDAVGEPGSPTLSLVQGMTLTRPSNWTLTHLPGEVNGAWPMLQLTNYDPGLNVAALCPQAASLPADGILLYVEMKAADEPAGYPPWPVQPNSGEKGPGTCGTGLHPRWTMGASSFEGYLAFGPKASERDQRLLLDAFASLDLRDRGRIVFWHDLDRYSGLSSNPLFAEAAHVLQSLDPTGRYDGYGRFFNLLDFSGSLVREEPGGFTELEPFKPGEHIEFGGDHMQGDSGIVDGSVITSADVARVEIQAKDGRIIPCRLWAPAAGLRFGQFEFEEPLVGEFVAYDDSGKVLDRERYALWPP